MPIIERNSSDILYSTSEDSDDSEYTTTLLRNQWLDQRNKSIKALYAILMNSDCKNQSNEMLPFAAVSSSTASPQQEHHHHHHHHQQQQQQQQPQQACTPKRGNKRQANKMLPYQMLDSRISSTTQPPSTMPTTMMMMMPSSPSSSSSMPHSSTGSGCSGGKKRKKTQGLTELEESHEYINNVYKTYCFDAMPSSSTISSSSSSSNKLGTITRYANLNDMLLTNEALYTALMLQMGKSIMETACLHCRNLANMDLLEWSEAVLIQLCAINYTHLLYNTWSSVISLVESSEWGPKMSLNLQRIYGRSVRLSHILDMNHTMKIEKYNMPPQFVFRENRIPALNMQLLKTIPRCDRDDLEEMNLRQSLARLPIVIRKKKNVIQ